MAKRIASLVVLSVFLAFPFGAAADEAPSLEALVVEMADSPAEHASVARHFREKADEARTQARRHESMGRAYGGGKMGTRTALRGHCNRLVEQYQAMAAEYDELAKLHDQVANAAP